MPPSGGGALGDLSSVLVGEGGDASLGTVRKAFRAIPPLPSELGGVQQRMQAATLELGGELKKKQSLAPTLPGEAERREKGTVSPIAGRAGLLQLIANDPVLEAAFALRLGLR